MAVLTHYLRPATLFGGATNAASTDTSAPATATTATGWTVAKLSAPNYNGMGRAVEKTTGFSVASTFSSGISADQSSHFLIGPLSGTFAAGDFTIAYPVVAVSNGGTQDGRMRAFLKKASTIGGTDSSIAPTASGTTVTNLAVGTPQTSTVTINLASPAVFTNEYLIIQSEWEITGAAGNNSADVLLREGSACSLTTTDLSVGGMFPYLVLSSFQHMLVR